MNDAVATEAGATGATVARTAGAGATVAGATGTGIDAGPVRSAPPAEEPERLDPDADGEHPGHRRHRPDLARFVRLSMRPVGIFVASRIGVLAVAWAVAYAERLPVKSMLYKWDSGWYVLAAAQGYPHTIPSGHGGSAQSTLGFFPLLPALIRVAHDVTGISWQHSGLLVTFLAGIVAAVVVWWLLHDLFGAAGADRGTALVFFTPGAFVLSMIYSESVLIALAAGALFALQRRRWLVAGVCAGFATATDPVASAIVVPCLFAAVQAIRRRREWKALLAPVLAPAGIVAFFCFLWVRTGTPRAWFIAQRRGWQNGSLGTGIVNEVRTVIHQHLSQPNASIKLVSLVVIAAFLVVFLRARPPGTLVAYVAAVLGVALLSPIVGFSPRVALRGFPLLGVVGARLRSPWFEIVFGLSALGMAALAVLSMGSLGFTP